MRERPPFSFHAGGVIPNFIGFCGGFENFNYIC